MFDRILIPTDLTDKSQKAIEIALKVCTENSGKIILLHVIETLEDAGEDEFSDFYEKLKNRAERKLNKIIQNHRTTDMPFEQVILFGNRVREIISYATAADIDLIILSSHPIDPGESQAGWATISYRVGILARCPVMMVK